MPRVDARRFALGGLLGVTGYFALENVGVAWSTATDAALLGAAYPAIIVTMDVLLNRAMVCRRAGVGIGLAFVGAVGIVAGRWATPSLWCPWWCLVFQASWGPARTASAPVRG